VTLGVEPGGQPVGVLTAKVRPPGVQGLPRTRLEARLDEVWSCRLAVVVAPAGSGKTTLLARFAASTGTPFGWYRAESWDAPESRLLRHLQAALTPTLGEQPPWPSLEAAIAALETWPGSRLLLVVDDLHTIAGSPAERSLERLLEYAPPHVAVAVASRSLPAWNLSRLRVSGAMIEVGGDDLRFRSWEVERLFSDFYREPLPPVELAELARRTEGWAAGLQLFHLASSGKPADERRRLLSGLGPHSRLAGEYLAENVLDVLPQELRQFLLATCVLGRLSGAICDEYRGSSDSQRLLEELEHRQLFTQRVDDEGTYRYHEVLRAHLEGLFVQSHDAEGVRVAYRTAGEVLLNAGAALEALRAFCRAEDWQSVNVLIGVDGDRLARQSGEWIEALPAALVEQDAWLLLARARMRRSAGRWAEAVESYQRAEAAFGRAEPGVSCRNERLALAAWMQPGAWPASDLLTVLRAAVARQPLEARDRVENLEPAQRELAAGLALLLAGHVAEAVKLLGHCGNRADATPALAASACLGAGIARFLAGEGQAAADVEGVVDHLEEMGHTVLARIGHAASTLSGWPEAAGAAGAVRLACLDSGDAWGEAVAGLLEGWAGVQAGLAPDATLEAAATAFRRLGAGTLEAWARALLALAMAREGAPGAREAALQAEAFARSTGVPASQLYAYLALAELEAGRAGDFARMAEALLAETGLAAPRGRQSEPSSQPPDEVRVRCFGGVAVRIRGVDLDLSQLKPKARSLLRYLAVNAGNPVHREVIQEALWPELDPESGARGVQVAISSVRQALEPGVARGASSLLRRDGESYRLALGGGVSADLVEFEEAAGAARSAAQQSDLARLAKAFERMRSLHTGELMPEEGSAEWILGPRERCRSALAETAQALAGLLLDAGRPDEAAHVCSAGLQVERYRDGLWRLLVSAREAAGEVGAATRARSEYEQVLAELGVA
jgi:DNA-binding SARP family transcriptional activator